MATDETVGQGPGVALFDRFDKTLPASDPVLASIRLELLRLTNSRASDTSKPPPDEVTGYGIPDLSTYSVADEGIAARLTSRLTAAIAAFEPRLRRTAITIHPIQDEPDRLALSLQAVLAGEPVRLDLTVPRRP